MTEIVTLEAELRDRAGKGAARATRRDGRVPAVIYGDKQEPIMISLDPKVLGREMHRGGFFGRLVDVKLDGKTHRTLPRDVQLHPVTDVPLHVDFVRVNATTKIHVAVAVAFENHEQSPGLKKGGVLNVVRHEIELICAANNIPDRLHIDLTGHEIGDSIHISALKLPEGVAPAIADRDFTIATIAAPTVAQDAEATAGGAAA
jgi:large subunit ribosomal protein L25